MVRHSRYAERDQLARTDRTVFMKGSYSWQM